MDYWKSYPYFASHAANSDVQCGVCSLELPTARFDQHGDLGDNSVWAQLKEFNVSLSVLCHGAAAHRVVISTRTASTFDARRCAFVWDECVTFPLKVRDLTGDALLTLCVEAPRGNVIASASAPLFDGDGALRQGLVKVALFDDFQDGEFLGHAESVRRASKLGGGHSAFVDELRGDDQAPSANRGYGRYSENDHLFRAEVLRETLARNGADDARKNPAKSAHAWLDALTLERVGSTRHALEDREAWLGSACATAAEREMAHRAFLVIELPTFAHPVLYDEKPYAGAPATPKVAAVLRPDQNDPALYDAAAAADAIDGRRNADESHAVGISLDGDDDARLEAWAPSSDSQSSGERRRRSARPSEAAYETYDVYDYEAGGCLQPIEDKYRALGRDATRQLVDRDLKPSIAEARAIQRVVGTPSDALLPRDRELLWKFRYTLTSNKQALTKFLVAVDWRAEAEVSQVRELLQLWAAIDVADALKLLGPEKAFQHEVVRAFAVAALSAASDEELIAYLLQLVQALRYEALRDAALVAGRLQAAAALRAQGGGAVESAAVDDDDLPLDSPLAAFLCARAVGSVSVANFMWWYLKVGAEDTSDEAACAIYRVYRGRFAEALARQAPRVYATLRAQEELVVAVLRAQGRAREEKGRKDHKQAVLRALLADLRMPPLLATQGVPMPLDPSVTIVGLDDPLRTVRMYRSAMYPALVAFERKAPGKDGAGEIKRPPPEAMRKRDGAATPKGGFFDDVVGSMAASLNAAAFGGDDPSSDSTKAARPFDVPVDSLVGADRVYRVMVKNGDDIRQDQLVMQFVLLMDLLLKRINLDLKLTCFRVLATGVTSGLLEFVEDSHAISTILADHNNSIAAFLRRHNADASQPDGVSAEARDNFTKSCAGYCVITYLLGIGDRHLDNIMVRTNGCLFHIDFGFILGKDPKPYPPPFRLTREMAEAMGYPDDPNYTHKFKCKCCQAFSCLRRHAPLLLNLMSLMKDAGIEHLSEESDVKLQKFQDRFRLDLSDEDAERFFLSLINESLNALVPVVLERFHKIAVWMK
ncbi:hypothetical protein M885DRAFT_219886 [Pelagophyceae sp. CCMP2097]|nr:hypothetical protein M885DRAFT_219886 [Pelagophyceae sp. CCMP2097]